MSDNTQTIDLSIIDVRAVLGALQIFQFLSRESYLKYGEEGLLATIDHVKSIEADIRQQTGLN